MSSSSAAEISCGGDSAHGCGALLAYPRGSAAVRCALCGFVTPTHGERDVVATSRSARTAVLRCAGCDTALSHAAEATHVRCAVCDTVNVASARGGGEGNHQQPHQPSPRRLSGERPSSSTLPTYQQATIPMLLQGAALRERPVRTVMAYTECAGCLCTLMYPRGAASVQCAACGTVSSVALTSFDGSGGSNGSFSRASPGVKPKRAMTSKNLVVIENPPTLDARGNVVSYIAVGLKLDSDEE